MKAVANPGENHVKNGRTATGQQQYHCRACGIYTVTDDRARERAIKMKLVEKLHRERVSRRGIARATGIPPLRCLPEIIVAKLSCVKDYSKFLTGFSTRKTISALQ
jgi:hypothetical protein